MNYQQIVAEMRANARPVSRRSFFVGTAASMIGLAYPGLSASQSTPIASPVLMDNPFTLGVASGEPLPDGVVLWTRLAPDPFEPNGGMPLQPVEVEWLIARDVQCTDIVQSGIEIASPDWAHSVHVEVSGLDPDTWYFYRFQVGAAQSPVGKTRTTPAPGTIPDSFRFAFASCQNWGHGLFNAWRDAAQQSPDLIVHLGDYIYESSIPVASFRPSIPMHVVSEIWDLEQYRNRHALYKLDTDLQEAHRIAPWIVTWDDHEVSNDYIGALDPENQPAKVLLARRAAAYQAYYEHMPLRKAQMPEGSVLPLHRAAAYGDLISFSMLDCRQYRSPARNACNDGNRVDGYCADAVDSTRTLLGADQKNWLLNRLPTIQSRWHVLGNSVPIARIDYDADPEQALYGADDMDKWDGFAVERDEVIATLAGAAASNGFHPVVITGDVHANYTWDLKTDWDDESSASVFGTEFVGTSVASNGDRALKQNGGFTTVCGQLNGNTHNHLFDNHRGYVLCDVTAEQWRSEYRVFPTVESVVDSATPLVSFVLEHSTPGAQLDGSCVGT